MAVKFPSPSFSLVAARWLGSWTVGWLASLAPTTINANLASNFFLQESLHSPASRSATCTGAELLLGMHPPSLASRHPGKTVDEAYSMTRISTFSRESRESFGQKWKIRMKIPSLINILILVFATARLAGAWSTGWRLNGIQWRF